MYPERKIFASLPVGFTAPEELSRMDANASILVGFSGGADSSALLHILSRYAKETGIKIYAAHVNHGIRGDEADRDERFCKELAKKLGVEFFSKRFDVPAIAKESGESIETAARNVRYEYFDLLMKEHSIPLLATAHNADDNLETVIFNICRGSGLCGMCGIPSTRPCKHGTVIRPILGMEKCDIIKYCADNGLDFVTDSTNADKDYTRNKIRSEIIPILKQINSGAVSNAYRMTKMLRKDSDCLDGMAEEMLVGINENDFSIDAEKICNFPSPISSRAIMQLYSMIANEKSLEATHVDALLALAKKRVPHSSASLPNGIEGVIEGSRLCLRRRTVAESIEEYQVSLLDGENRISQTNSKIFIGNSHSEKNVYKKSTLLSIDFDSINGELVARNRRAGDKIKIGGMSKSLKKLMCDKKIPIELRARIPIICDSKGILAVPFIGVRDGAKYSPKNGQTELNIYFYLV